MDSDFEYQLVKPDPVLSDFVESFWMLENRSGNVKEVVILPDGRIDLFLSRSSEEPFEITLIGLETKPGPSAVAPGALMFAVSFRPLAAEYLFPEMIARLLDKAMRLPADFWGFSEEDLDDFGHFCAKASKQIQTLIPPVQADDRKRKLFDLIYSSEGALSVQELSEKVHWNSRQINRYFNKQFGLPMKTYCQILRFRASFTNIREGKLFPEQHFSDQAHFIKEVKKLAGVIPKELLKNQNDRFIQFSTLPRK